MQLKDYIILIKPRISFLVLITVFIGALLASEGPPDWLLIIAAVLGTFFVACGANSLNQLMEKDSDAKMQRTQQRPLPAGRLTPQQVLWFGLGSGLFGILFLGVWVDWLAGTLALITFVSYVLFYTPLKRQTTFNTFVGAIPGALPPVIGWAAVQGSIGLEAWLLFSIIYFWQFPHFLAIAWLYRDDYARADMQMLPVKDPTGAYTGLQVLAYTLVLLPITLLPALFQFAGRVYFAGALILGLIFLIYAFGFWLRETNKRARSLLRASIIYLPILFFLLVIGK